MRHQPFFAAGDKDMRKLQPLRGVHRGQAHRVGIGLLAIQSRQQRDRLGQLDQRLSVLLAALGDPGHEIGDALPALTGLAFIAGRQQVLVIIDGLEQLLEQLARRLLLGAPADPVDELAELTQRPDLARRQMRLGAALKERREHRALALRGIVAQRLQGLGADAALWRGDGSDEGRIVVVVGQQAQPGDHIANLGALEPRLAARQHVRNLLLAQRLLDDPRLMVAAIEHRIVRELASTLEAQ